MWKPSSVVPQHRTRATLVWVAILVTAFAYTVWQAAVVIRKRQNPSTKLLVSNQRYQFPLVSVCLDNGYGCGYNDGSIDACVASALWSSYALYGDDDDGYIEATQGQETNCVKFDLTQVQVPEGERETAAGVTATISMEWVSSDNATAETEYSVGVHVYLGDSDSGDQGEEEMAMLPYSRNVVSSSDRSYDTTALAIGKTHRKYLSGASVTTYPVLTISTTRFVTTPAWDESLNSFLASSSASSTSSYPSAFAWNVTEDSAIGTLHMDITQGSYSHTEVEDVEPLEIGALFGNVGGFWELLVLAWGVFFITKSRDREPTLKARNFAKVVQRGGGSKRKLRKLDSATAEEAGYDGARPPDWESSSEDDMQNSGASDSRAMEKDKGSRQHHTHHPARPKRPIAYPASYRVASHPESSSLGISATTSSNSLVQSRGRSTSTADGTGSNVSSTTKMRRWSGSNAASAASKLNTYDAGNARTSFFPTLHVAASQVHHGSEDESSPSATRPARGKNKFVENIDEAGENELELGYGGDSEGRHGEA